MTINARRRHRLMEKAIKRLMAANEPTSIKFTDSASDVQIEAPVGVTVPTTSEIEAEFNTLVGEEDDDPKMETVGDIKIGTLLVTDRTNSRVGIGTSTPQYTLHVNGPIYSSSDITMFSDERKKTNIEPIPNALEKILKLEGVTFDKVDDGTRRHAGIIAQEVEKVLPEVVYTDEDGMKSVAYGNMIALLIEAIKELANK